MIDLPQTTKTLLEAVAKCGEIERVCIRPQQIEYFPCNTRKTGQNIVDSGIGDLVQRFVTHRLSKTVAAHFRLGSYDISGKEIKVLK